MMALDPPPSTGEMKNNNQLATGVGGKVGGSGGDCGSGGGGG
jgi:hypothetical protein